MTRTMWIWVGLAAAVAVVSSLWVSEHVFHRAPITTDEQGYLLQAHILSTGRIKYPPPPLIQPFRYPMIIVDENVGWMSRYPPGHAAWLMFGVWLKNPYFMVALAAGLGLMFTVAAARRMGASGTAAALLLLLSPFYVFTYGTLMSHVSGYIAAAGMLLAYIKWQQGGRAVWAVLAGLAWAWLFLNRTYTAILLALPFAVDALWYLWTRRNRQAFWGVAGFAGSAAAGILAILVYNKLALGDPLTMTYLYYDPTDNLGFGLRHHWPVFPAPLPVEHTFLKGLSDLKDNILLLDQWLFGFRGGLLIWLGLMGAGWSRRWSPLLTGSALSVMVGYLFFWYPGWNETGPNYYFEIYPAMVLAASLGVAALWRRGQHVPRFRMGLALALIIGWGGLAAAFSVKQGRYLQDQTRLRSAAMETMKDAPEKSLVLIRGHVTEVAWPNHDLVFSPTAVEGPVIVARWLEESNMALLRHYPDYHPYLLDYRNGAFFLRDIANEVSLNYTFPIRHMARRTGTNKWDKDNPGLYVRLARKGHAAGFLMFGRSIYLYPGRFELAFDVKATSAEAATLQLAADRGARIIATREAPLSEQWVTVSMVVELDEFLQAEPRVIYHGKGDIQISGVRITEVPRPAVPSID